VCFISSVDPPLFFSPFCERLIIDYKTNPTTFKQQVSCTELAQLLLKLFVSPRSPLSANASTITSPNTDPPPQTPPPQSPLSTTSIGEGAPPSSGASLSSGASPSSGEEAEEEGRGCARISGLKRVAALLFAGTATAAAAAAASGNISSSFTRSASKSYHTRGGGGRLLSSSAEWSSSALNSSNTKPSSLQSFETLNFPTSTFTINNTNTNDVTFSQAAAQTAVTPPKHESSALPPVPDVPQKQNTSQAQNNAPRQPPDGARAYLPSTASLNATSDTPDDEVDDEPPFASAASAQNLGVNTLAS